MLPCDYSRASGTRLITGSTNREAVMAGTGIEETAGLTDEKEKRVVKPTLKGLEHNLQMKIPARRALLGHLTQKKYKLHALMDDDANVENVGKELLTKYEGLIKEFNEINVHVKDLFFHIGCEENMVTDQREWFEPRNSEHTDFVQDVNEWMQAAKLHQEESKKISDEIQPEVVSKKSKKSKSVSAASTTLSARSERLKIELDKAALLAMTATLKRKQALEEHELQLKAEKEELELQARLTAANARLAVLRKYEGSEASSRTRGGSNLYFSEA